MEHSSAWSWLGGALLTVGLAAFGVSAALAADPDHNVWGTAPAIAAYALVGLRFACFAAAVLGLPFRGLRRPASKRPSVEDLPDSQAPNEELARRWSKACGPITEALRRRRFVSPYDPEDRPPPDPGAWEDMRNVYLDHRERLFELERESRSRDVPHLADGTFQTRLQNPKTAEEIWRLVYEIGKLVTPALDPPLKSPKGPSS